MLAVALLIYGVRLSPLNLRTRAPRMAVFSTQTIPYDGQTYTVKVQEASALTGSEKCPPILCIPPVGVGITREFFEPLHREWAMLGAPAALHTPDLLGCGDAQPKPRRFYTPEIWAAQLLAYVNGTVKEPVIVLTQGGLLPVALEMWKQRGTESVAGVSFVSPPPLRFFAPQAESEPGVRPRFADDDKAKKPSKRQQRLLWLAAQSTVGGAFYRYLRAGKGQPRIRAFSERNLFASASNVDDEWMDMCYNGARDTRGRFATLAYLCGTVPGGSWREDRTDLLQSLEVPSQVLRGDAVVNASERLASFVERVPNPSCCHLIEGGRAVLPYENAKDVARYLAEFLQANYDKKVMWTSERAVRKVLDTLKD